MPLYRYKCDNGHITEQWFNMDAVTKDVQCPMCGKTAAREYGARTQGTTTWPLYSDAMGVAPSQVQQAMTDAHQKGVKLEFTSDGRAIFQSAKHRREVCRAYGMIDRNGGYSDP